MAKNKTTENDSSVEDFLNAVSDDLKRADCFELSAIIADVTGLEAKMWGNAIIGFGSYHYIYESGRAGDAPLIGFSPRKNAIVLYLSPEFKHRDQLLGRFGKHKTGKSCVYIQKLNDNDLGVLKQMITNSVESIRSTYS
ncbi:DUF1801 domain-containing protein [Pedobacter sp. BMA]|uniref:DUF1801 domain-containing protein n=1 Tax=Pedobacter sp. BMA TaxID=1663685 RepID=UPI00064933FE|nr:DUF1801 domain-containing protein [Pedobacter sp. BMA]KLT66083.1 hypothetical protein AB669_07910 [Pedobacter sp. BMA]